MVEGYLPNNPACSWYRHCTFWCRHCMLLASCPQKHTAQTPTSLGLSAPRRVVSTGSPDMETMCFRLHEQERCQWHPLCSCSPASILLCSDGHSSWTFYMDSLCSQFPNYSGIPNPTACLPTRLDSPARLKVITWLPENWTSSGRSNLVHTSANKWA